MAKVKVGFALFLLIGYAIVQLELERVGTVSLTCGKKDRCFSCKDTELLKRGRIFV